jgi:sigma-B regulation protein RsbU (phosphoserine phosphatase)
MKHRWCIILLSPRPKVAGSLPIKIVFSIRWKLILSIVLPLLLIAGVVMGVTLKRVYVSAVSSLQQQRLLEVSLLARSIDNELISLARIAEDTAAFMRVGTTPQPDELYALLAENASRTPLIYGAAIAFAPYVYDSATRLFAPYVYDDDFKAIDISVVAYDYTTGEWPWYSDILGSEKGQWIDPYFDTGAGNLAMTTYSVPLYRDGTFLGVTTVDLRLDELSREISDILRGQRFMIMTRDGTFVSHYQPEQALNSSLQQFANDQSDTALGDTIEDVLSGNTGIEIVENLHINGETLEGNSWILYTPIASSGWLLASIQSEAELTQPLREQLGMAIGGLSLTILLILVLVWISSSRMALPIKKLEAAVSDVARGKLDTHIENIRSKDELGRLSIGFNRMLRNLKKQIDLQSQQEASQRMLEREWQMARETQKSLLPNVFPPFPERREFELHAVNQAAHHVAGDFFDFFLINPRTLVFVIADVSGKGMSAALVMAVTRTIVRNLAQSGKSPADILRETNDRLRENHKGTAFVTIFLGTYNTNSGRILYANGGHTPPFVLDRNGQASQAGEATGTIVGMLEHQEYRNAEMRLQTGETLVLFTDGFPEARSPSGDFYGSGRIKQFLENNAGNSASVICESAVREISQFQHEHLADDITILALKRNPTGLGGLLSDLVKSKT